MFKLSADEVKYREELSRFKTYYDRYPDNTKARMDEKKKLRLIYNQLIADWDSAVTQHNKQAVIDRITERNFLLKLYMPLDLHWKDRSYHVTHIGRAQLDPNFFDDISNTQKDLFKAYIQENWRTELPRFYWDKYKIKIVVMLLISLALTAMMLLGPPGFLAGFMVALPVLTKLGIGQMMWSAMVQAITALPTVIFGVTNAATIAGTAILSVMASLAIGVSNRGYKEWRYQDKPIDLVPPSTTMPTI